jgi:hypothetical protein
MNMHAKIQNITKVDICNKYSCIWVLKILHKDLIPKSQFGQAHYEEWFKRSPTKFIL